MVGHYNKRKRTYGANPYKGYASPSGRTSTSNDLLDYFKKFIAQSLVCFSLFLGILVMQQAPDSVTSQGIKGMVLNETPFSRYNQMYQNLILNLFPLSYRVPAKPVEFTAPVGGMNGMTEEEVSEGSVSYAGLLAKESYANIIFKDYADGILIRIDEAQGIGSLISGIVTEKGASVNNQYGNFIRVQQADGWLLTFGFLEDITVSRMEYLEIGDLLGFGSQIPYLNEEAAYYLAVQNPEGEYMDSIEYLNKLIHEAGE